MTTDTNPFRRREGDPPPAGGPAFNVPPATLIFLGVIGAVYAIQHFGGPSVQFWIIVNGSVIPVRFAAFMAEPFSTGFWLSLATLMTHALIHVDGLHILANAGFMLAFGSMAERMLGTRRFVILVVASAVGGAVAQLAGSWGEFSVMFGASGVVSGCIGAVLATMALTGGPGSPRRRIAVNMALILVVANLVIGLGGQWFQVSAGLIAWQAHLGGFLVGIFLPIVTREW